MAKRDIKLVLVGSAPSSGSTMLADLLDSTPFSLCGPELNLFSVKALYALYKSQKRNKKKFGMLHSLSSSIYAVRNRPFINNMSAYGLDPNILEWLLNQTQSFQEFVEVFVNWYASLRDRTQEVRVVFEKTPQNINVIADFLENYPSGYFVVIVRNPIYVFWSLLRRGFTPFQAVFTWLIDNAHWIKFSSHSRVIVLRYEDVIKGPFKTVQKILTKVAKIEYTDKKDFMNRFQNNLHRMWHERFRGEKTNTLWKKAWSETRVGVITDANSKPVPREIISMFKYALNFEVDPRYARQFELETTSYLALIEYLQYNEIIGIISKVKETSPVTLTFRDRKFMLRKSLYALLTKSNRSAMKAIFSPVRRK